MKKTLILLVFIFIAFITNCLLAQKQGQALIDSLLPELPKAVEDTNKANILISLGSTYYSINPDKGIEYAKMGLELSKKIRWRMGVAGAYSAIGTNFWSKGQFDIALSYHNQALKIHEDLDYKPGIASDLSNIGHVNVNLSNYPVSLEYFQRALKINEELGNKTGIGVNLGNIGVVYVKLSNYQLALEYFKKALNIYELLGNKNGIAKNNGNIGSVYINLMNYPLALEYYQKALAIYYELGNKTGIASNLCNIGIVHMNLLNYPAAIENFLRSLKISEEIGNKRGIAKNLSSLGSLYFTCTLDSVISKVRETQMCSNLKKKSILDKSLSYLLQAVVISEEIGDKENLIDCYNILQEIYSSNNDFINAYKYHVKWSDLKDSVFSQEKSEIIAKLESKKLYELKEKQIQLQKSEMQKQKANQLLMLVGIASLFIIVFGLGFLMAQLNKHKKLSEKLLLNILPQSITDRLMNKEYPIADQFEIASVVFIDMVNFTNQSVGVDPKIIVAILNKLYSKLDQIALKNGLEKIKTIGDCYMAASGIPISDPDCVIKAASFAIEAMEQLRNYKTDDGTELNFRCGIDCGRVVAGVIGENKFIYDLWGDTVNTASRMENSGITGKIQVTEKFMEKLLADISVLSNEQKENLHLNEFHFEERGNIEIKGKGVMRTYFLEHK